MTTRAKVAEIRPNSCIEVELVPPPRCGGCTGACAWFQPPATGRLRLRSGETLRVGDKVCVSLPARYVLTCSTLLHGVPLAALLLGALAGTLLHDSDFGALFGAILGFSVVLALTPGWLRRTEHRALSEFHVERLD